MIYVTDLLPGDEIQGWMKLGFALKKQRRVDGTLFYAVPDRASNVEKDDLTRFVGWIVSNNTTTHVLVVEVVHLNSRGRVYGDPIQTTLHYSVLKRVRKISRISYPARAQNPLRPTHVAIGTGYSAYRTVEEVMLKWS
jgi:hypothetical protein